MKFFNVAMNMILILMTDLKQLLMLVLTSVIINHTCEQQF